MSETTHQAEPSCDPPECRACGRERRWEVLPGAGINAVCATCDTRGSFDNLKPQRAAARTHELKTWPEYFEAVLDGRKPFEIRLNDRGFRVGDRLHLREYLPDAGTYTGRAILARVSYMTNYAQRAGYVVMGLQPDAELVHLYGSWTVTGESE